MDAAHKESFDLARPYSDISEWERAKCDLYHERPWFDPEDESLKQYKWIMDRFHKFFKLYHSIGLQVIRYIAIGLGKSPDYFDPWFEKECGSTFSLTHFNPTLGNYSKSEMLEKMNMILVRPEDTDPGFVTLSILFNGEGL